VLAEREPFLREQADYLRKKHEHDLGLLTYYFAMPTEHVPSAFTALATGLRDVHPFSQHLRLLGLVPQSYASELGSPLEQLSGSFDYAFVISFLLPLLVIALGYDVASRDQALGTELLLCSQPSRRSRLITLRLALSAGFVTLTALLLLGAAVVLARLPRDARILWWLAMLLAYIAFWTLLVGMVATLGRSSGWNALVLVGTWIALCVLLPAAANVALMPSSTQSAVAFTLTQRELVNAGWDKPKQATMEPFFQRRPEWRDTQVPEDRFSWTWYYAMHEVGDAAVAHELDAYRLAQETHERFTHWAAMLLPPLAVQRALSRLAGSDLAARLAYQDSVARHHEALKSFFYPLIFRDAQVSSIAFDQVPRHSFRREPSAPQRSELAALLLLAAGLLCAGSRLSRRLDS
jgi:ABC-2 type transport system permease protein